MTVPTIRPCAIHQFTPSISLGDGVSNAVFFTQTLLHELGFASEVFSSHIPAELTHRVRPIRAYPLGKAQNAHQLLIIHHSIGIDIEEYTTASTKRFNEPVNISREMFFKLWNKLKFISYIEKR